MNELEGSPWTIDELGARVAEALSFDYLGAPNDRVRAVPDRRTIRYYTTLGLIDRPSAIRGRTAYYGRRHLMQLVAIKRLQAEGHSLAEVQRRLLGLTDAVLGRLARLSGPEVETPSGRNLQAGGRQGDAFWKSEPAAANVVDASAARGAVSKLLGLSLGPGATLLLESGRALDVEDVDAIRKAAGPLIRCLESLRLVIGRRDEEGGGRDGRPAADLDR